MYLPNFFSKFPSGAWDQPELTVSLDKKTQINSASKFGVCSKLAAKFLLQCPSGQRFKMCDEDIALQGRGGMLSSLPFAALSTPLRLWDKGYARCLKEPSVWASGVFLLGSHERLGQIGPLEWCRHADLWKLAFLGDKDKFRALGYQWCPANPRLQPGVWAGRRGVTSSH